MKIKKKRKAFKQMGKLVVYTGPMMSSKTSSMLRKLSIMSSVGKKCLYINNSLDTRSNEEFSTHSPLFKGSTKDMKSVTFHKTSSLTFLNRSWLLEFDAIGIDEAQFFGDLFDSVKDLVEGMDKYVIVAGLESDYNRSQFGEVLRLSLIADEYIKLTSICVKCAPQKIEKALFTKFVGKASNSNINVGGIDMYKPVCRECYLK